MLTCEMAETRPSGRGGKPAWTQRRGQSRPPADRPAAQPGSLQLGQQPQGHQFTAPAPGVRR